MAAIAGFTEPMLNDNVPLLICLLTPRIEPGSCNGDKAVLRTLKQGCLTAGRSCGLFQLASSSYFRNSRLLVLGYHGVSLEDEHRWDPSLFLSADIFRRRMEALKRSACTVLSLEEGLSLTTRGELPDRAVVLTFDDGTYDFYKIVWPILREFGYPATLYLTTYYVELPYPVPREIWSYMLWRTGISRVNAREILEKDVIFNLTDKSGREEAFRKVVSFADSEKMDGHHRNILSAKLAELLEIDFDALCRSRICQLLRPEEVHELARDGVSVQMHMHHHNSPPTHEAFIDNLRVNRQFITEMTGSAPNHFCYPSGYYNQQSVMWLRDYGIESATTCDLGLCSVKTDPLLIPRLIDSSYISDIGFESWLVGVGAVLSHMGAFVPRTRKAA
jgi:peptidoglycan/xylan/chitin deacetylase (PgdA/CDA1 family)